MKVLLSIKPEYVEKIFHGSKRYEYRKVVFSNKEVDTVVVYATMPIGKIVGEFKILEILSDAPGNIWRKTKKYGGIDESFFNTYFKGRTSAHAIKIGEVKRYDEPLNPEETFENFTAPQSFFYIKDEPLLT